MAWIERADHETVSVRCDNCGELCVFNRREDFEDTGPYGGENVICPYCHRPFRMTGDTVNPVYELFMFAAREHVESKRYMLAIATMAQAWEVFFATFAAARFVFAPFFASPDDDRDIDALNERLAQLDDATKHFAFARWRNLLLNTVARGIKPRNLDESERAIQQIVPGGLGNEPPAAVIVAVGEDDVRALLEEVRGLTVGNLRNSVLHYRAYRPLRAEAERCVESEVETLYRAKHLLKVGTFDEFHAGVV